MISYTRKLARRSWSLENVGLKVTKSNLFTAEPSVGKLNNNPRKTEMVKSKALTEATAKVMVLKMENVKMISIREKTVVEQTRRCHIQKSPI